MPAHRGLSILYRMHEQELTRRVRALALIRQEQLWAKQQLDRLLEYQREYHLMVAAGLSKSPQSYGDQQLFLQRLDANVSQLQRGIVGLDTKESEAVAAVNIIMQKNASLRSAIDNIESAKLEEKISTEVSQCDEQSIMASARRSGNSPLG